MMRIVQWLIKNEAIEAQDAELYEYALRSLGLLMLPLILALLCGSLFDCAKESVFVVLPFMLIRKYSGGYHASRWWVCFISSTLTIGFGVWVVTVAHVGLLQTVCVFLSMVSLILCSPIDSPQKPLDEMEKNRYKLTTAVLTCVFGGVYLLWRVLEWNMAASAMAVGIILAALMQMPCLLGKVCKNNQNR